MLRASSSAAATGAGRRVGLNSVRLTVSRVCRRDRPRCDIRAAARPSPAWARRRRGHRHARERAPPVGLDAEQSAARKAHATARTQRERSALMFPQGAARRPRGGERLGRPAALISFPPRSRRKPVTSSRTLTSGSAPGCGTKAAKGVERAHGEVVDDHVGLLRLDRIEDLLQVRGGGEQLQVDVRSARKRPSSRGAVIWTVVILPPLFSTAARTRSCNSAPARFAAVFLRKKRLPCFARKRVERLLQFRAPARQCAGSDPVDPARNRSPRCSADAAAGTARAAARAPRNTATKSSAIASARLCFAASAAAATGVAIRASLPAARLPRRRRARSGARRGTRREPGGAARDPAPCRQRGVPGCAAAPAGTASAGGTRRRGVGAGGGAARTLLGAAGGERQPSAARPGRTLRPGPAAAWSSASAARPARPA